MQSFFTEWDARLPNERRSLDRARLLARQLGLTTVRTPLLTIVGSKGKGTAATYASAYLAATGARVITVTSPSYRTHRERIRTNGRALPPAQMTRLTSTVAEAADRLPPHLPGTGYLAPSGLFTLAALLHARSAHADFIVLEAGRGGRSDEASLFPPAVAAITPIFEEHLGELGDTIADIALDKASIIGPPTRAVLSAPQPDAVAQIIRRTAHTTPLEFPAPYTTPIPPNLLPPGLSTINAELGCTAAQRLLDLTTTPHPNRNALEATLKTVTLPGRLSRHHLPDGETTLLLDQAVNRAGAATALTASRSQLGGLDHVLLSLPDDKDLDGVSSELANANVTFVELTRPHLTFARTIPPHWNRIKEETLTPGLLTHLGPRILALGTFSFIALMINLLDIQTEYIFTPPTR